MNCVDCGREESSADDMTTLNVHRRCRKCHRVKSPPRPWSIILVDEQPYYGCYFPITDLNVDEGGRRGTGKPAGVTWLDAQTNEPAYVPGEWKCDACDFVVVKNAWNPTTGAIGRDSSGKIEACPNDGTALRRVRLDEACREARDETVKLGIENQNLKKGLLKEVHRLEHCQGLMDIAAAEGAQLLENNYETIEGIQASVFCIVGEHAAEMTAMIREWAAKKGLKL